MKKLTVAEYAELNCISVQAVYKKINRLNTIEEERNGRKQILIILDEEPKDKEDIIKPDSTSNSTSTPDDSTPKEQTNSTSNSTSTPDNSTPNIKPNSTNELNPNIIEILEAQLKEKDKQIERLQKATEEKDKQIKEQFERLTQLIARSQELEARAHTLLLEGETEKEPEQKQGKIIDINTAEKQENKQGFFSRLFKRKKEEQ